MEDCPNVMSAMTSPSSYIRIARINAIFFRACLYSVIFHDFALLRLNTATDYQRDNTNKRGCPPLIIES